jgi:potassium-transporting ATPase potassium-binding subunit
MTGNALLQIFFYLAIVVALVKPLGAYIAKVMSPERGTLAPGRIDLLLYRACGVDFRREMSWRLYATAFLAFNGVGTLAVYLILRLQAFLPWNPQGFGPIEPHTAFNIAASFATNTNWQNYGGETTLSYFTQMAALTVQNFVSAAAGISVLVALARALARRSAESIGNFWVDLTRSTLYVLLPLSMLLALVLVSQGVVQNLHPAGRYATVEQYSSTVTEQALPMGPAASQIAIKQLGTNGGGFFNVNSAHPFENPTPFSNFLQVLSIVLIPVALCFTFGRIVGDTRQGWALLTAMLILFIPFLFLATYSEQRGTPVLAQDRLDLSPTETQPGGNMEGKEVRFGITNSALWATATTAASNGSVNSMHDSFTPLGGLVAMFLIQLGEVVFGGVGSGLYGMLLFVILAVFVAGLMVGRTPEYLGKKIEAFDMKMVAIAILVPPLAVLLGTALTVVSPSGVGGLQDHGPHGFSEILYAFTSMGNNNGSAFGGYSANTPLVNYAGGLAMLFARYWVALPVLAIAGSLAKKKTVPAGLGTLPTHSTLFILLLTGTVLIVGILAFIPALALGPIVEHLQMTALR